MGGLECPRCGSSNVININLTAEIGGDALAFYSCHACDNRWWARDGEPVELAEVLELSKREPRRSGRTAS